MVGLARNTVTFEFYASRFSDYGLKYNPDIEVATADQLLPIIKNNLCIGFVPEFFLQDDNSVFKINTVEPIAQRSVCLVKRVNAQLGLAAKKLEKEILNQTIT